jgi:hypothetical protein
MKTALFCSLSPTQEFKSLAAKLSERLPVEPQARSANIYGGFDSGPGHQ